MKIALVHHGCFGIVIATAIHKMTDHGHEVKIVSPKEAQQAYESRDSLTSIIKSLDLSDISLTVTAREKSHKSAYYNTGYRERSKKRKRPYVK